MSDQTFEYSHERNPIFLAASKFYGAAVKLPLPRGSRAQMPALERASCTMALSIAEAIDIPRSRVQKLATATDRAAKVTAILRSMRAMDSIDQDTHDKMLALLRPVSDGIERLKQGPVEPSPIEARVKELEAEVRARAAHPKRGKTPVRYWN